jgi:molecular chaperone DnaJ
MAKRDYYELLGVGRDASADEIKSAYRTLAKKHHPDRNPGNNKSEQEFKNVSEAYEVLKDEQKRAAYNRFGHAAFEQGGPGPGGFDFNFTSSFADVFDDLFGDFMGGRREGRTASSRGADLRYNMQIALEQAYHGHRAKVRVPTEVACDACGGSGAASGSRASTCTTCGGGGKVRAHQGFFTVQRTCPACQGTGRVITDPCKDCRGAGRVHREKSLAVNIPAGVEDGTRVRLAGEGAAGLRGAPPGDLYIFVSIKPHRIFQRDGTNVYCRVPIPMTTAALGGAIEVPAVDGSRARVTIPAGTQSGHQFRLKNKGMVAMRSAGRGDMYIEAIVETPVNLNKRQKELLRELDGAGSKETSPQSAGFFDKVKDLWEDLRE